MLRTHPAQELLLLGLAHHVHEVDAVRDADAVEHLAEVRCRCGVDERAVALGAHRLDHAHADAPAEHVVRAGRARRRSGKGGALGRPAVPAELKAAVNPGTVMADSH